MTPDVSIVVPVFNETGNVGPLAREIAAAFAGQAYEMIFVDDASTDSTRADLIEPTEPNRPNPHELV